MTGDISTKLCGTGNSWEEQEKLNVLARDFGKLEEGRKDYVLELVRKLAGIHCEGEHGDAVFGKAAPPFQI